MGTAEVGLGIVDFPCLSALARTAKSIRGGRDQPKFSRQQHLPSASHQAPWRPIERIIS